MTTAEVDVLRAQLLAAAGQLVLGPSPPTVRQVVASFMADAALRYTPRGGRGELDNMQVAVAPLVMLFGDELACAIGPLHLRAIQIYLCREGYCANVVNAMIGRVRRVFRWAAGRTLIPVERVGALSLLPAVRAPEAPDRPRVLEAPQADVSALLTWLRRPADVGITPNGGDHGVLASIRPALPRASVARRGALSPRETLAAMIELQLLGSMRPGELCSMSGGEVDRSSACWVYRPLRHKTSWKGKRRAIRIGPRGQELMAPHLLRHGAGAVFRTILGTPWTANSYAQAVHRACKRAGVPGWSPNQLRHLAATLAEQRAGADLASHLLGHSDLRTTQRYMHGEEAAVTAYTMKYC